MLNEGQISLVWEKMIGAEVRSLYFASLAERYTRRKQIITGLTFSLSSAAAAALAAKAPTILPLLTSIGSAILTAYSIAVNLDKTPAKMARLHHSWNQLAADYQRLWDHWYEEEAEMVLRELQSRARDLSDDATTAGPSYDENLIDKWQDLVQAQHGLKAA